MICNTLQEIRRITTCESSTSLSAHHFVKLPSGKWCRTFGVPSDADLSPRMHLYHIRGKVWHMVKVD